MSSWRKRRASTSGDDIDSAGERERDNIGGDGARAPRSKPGEMVRIDDTDEEATLDPAVAGAHKHLQVPLKVVDPKYDSNGTCRIGSVVLKQLCAPGSPQEEILYQEAQRCFEVSGETVKGRRKSGHFHRVVPRL